MTASLLRLPPRVPRLSTVVAWTAPVLVAAFVYRFPVYRLTQLLTMTVLAAIAVVVARYPGGALTALVGLLPLQLSLLSWLYAAGVEPSLVRALGNWKDAIVLGLALAAAREVLAGRSRLDALDALALGYVGAIAAYVVLPEVFVPAWRPGGIYEKLQVFRGYAGMVILFVGARHAPIRRRHLERTARTVLGVAVVVCCVAVFEFMFPQTWNSFAVGTIQFPDYLIQVLDLPGSVVFDADGEVTVVRQGFVAGQQITRVGSLLFTPLILGFYLLVPLGLAVGALVRGRGLLGAHLVAGLIIVSLMVTLTRSAIIGALAIGLIALRRAPPGPARVRYSLVAAVALVLLTPVAVDAGLTARTSESLREEAARSEEGHLAAVQQGFSDLVREPLGTGPGTARFGSDQSYFVIGNEVGLASLVLFVMLLVRTLRSLARLAQPRGRDPDDIDGGGVLAGTVALGGIGIAVTSLFIYAWSDINCAWLFWGLAGAVLGVAQRGADDSRAAQSLSTAGL